MFRLVVLACVLACAYAALLPVAYSGLGYSALPYNAAPLAYNAAPLAYNAAHLAYNAAPIPAPVAYSAAAFPTYETVSHTVDVAHEPVEQHGYVIKY